MTTVLIADDEPLLAQHLQTELRTLWPALRFLPIARNGREAAERIAQEQPTLAFLDIRMPGLTGLEVAQGMEGDTHIVFVTAFDEYAVQAFEREAVDYLLKPVQRQRLEQTVQRLQRRMDTARDEASDARLEAVLHQLLPSTLPGGSKPPHRLRWIRASRGEVVHQIPIEQVLLFQADDKYTSVHTASAEHLIRTSLVELLPQLDPDQFVQVHRATVVNLEAVVSARRDAASRLFLTLQGIDREVAVSRAYVHRFRAM